MRIFYQCNPELFEKCKKTHCQKECTLTTFKEYAKTDEFGNPIIAAIDDLKEYYEILKKKRKLTHEEIEDLGICKERLIEYAFEIRQQQDTETIRLLQEISSKLDEKIITRDAIIQGRKQERR